MRNLLNVNQVELGNVFAGINYRGEEVLRRLVGGTYGSVTKWFLIDAKTFELKSRVQKTKEEVLEGFEIEAVSSVEFVEAGHIVKDIKECELGDVFYVYLNGELTPRQVVGGHAYGEDVYFAIDPNTGKRCSRTKETMEEVLDSYEIEFLLKK